MNTVCSACGKFAYHISDINPICPDCAKLDLPALLLVTRHAAIQAYRDTGSRPGRRVMSQALRKQRQVERNAQIHQHGKACSICAITKPAAEYHADTQRADGLQVWCKDCQRVHRALVRAGKRDQWPAVRAALQSHKPA